MRTLLRHCPSLPALTVRAMAHRVSKPKRRLYGSYTPTEFARIRSVALADVRATGLEFGATRNSCRSIGTGSSAASRAPSSWTAATARQERSWTGCTPAAASTSRSSYRRPASSISALLGHPDVATANALFPSKAEIFSAMVLLVCDRGYNASTLTSLTVPEARRRGR